MMSRISSRAAIRAVMSGIVLMMAGCGEDRSGEGSTPAPSNPDPAAQAGTSNPDPAPPSTPAK